MLDDYKKVDSKELKFKDTVFVRDIETKVFQAIVVKCLSKIDGISLIEGNFIDHLLGREGVEHNKGIYVEQDAKNHAIAIKVELNIAYGIPIPDKSDEIQNKIVADIQELTGLHVSSVHTIFKSLLPDEDLEKILAKQLEQGQDSTAEFFNEFSEEF